MATPKEVFSEIQSVTGALIEAGICIDQNFPAIREEGKAAEVGHLVGEGLSVSLRNVAYREIYDELISLRAFGMKLIDGGLLQMLYRYTDDQLSRHRLAFFPSPDLLEYQNNSEVYEEDEMYADIVARNIVTVPFRFDFDRAGFVAVEHPMSHLTIGQYRHCRVPVSAPLTPHTFARFVLSSFYNTPFRKFCADLAPKAKLFEPTVVDAECDGLHIRIGR